MKRWTAVILALCVCLSLASAQAAPARDMRQADVEIDPGMRMLAETVLGAAVFTGVQGLEENMAPAPSLAEAAFALGLYNLSLPHDGGDLMDSQAVLPGEEARAMYALLFCTGEYALPAQASVAGVTVSDGQLVFDLTALQTAPMVGVHIYSARLEEAPGQDADTEQGTVELAADLYSYYGDFSTDALDVPEDALTWLCNAEIALEKAPDTAYGYRVKRFALSDQYEDGMLSDWNTVENAVCEYSVNLPSILGLAEDDPAHMVWQTADGSATLRIDTESVDGRTADQVLSAFEAAHPGREIVRQEEFCCYDSTGEGDWQLWVISGDLDMLYHVSMQFPAERQAEYTLYSEFIRNSMIAWGISNG